MTIRTSEEFWGWYIFTFREDFRKGDLWMSHVYTVGRVLYAEEESGPEVLGLKPGPLRGTRGLLRTGSKEPWTLAGRQAALWGTRPLDTVVPRHTKPGRKPLTVSLGGFSQRTGFSLMIQLPLCPTGFVLSAHGVWLGWASTALPVWFALQAAGGELPLESSLLEVPPKNRPWKS